MKEGGRFAVCLIVGVERGRKEGGRGYIVWWGFGGVGFLRVTLLVFGLLRCQRRIPGVLMSGCRATPERQVDK